jgi:hypothetical protein
VEELKGKAPHIAVRMEVAQNFTSSNSGSTDSNTTAQFTKWCQGKAL